jgi:serine/threonine-protein kinase
MDEKALLGTTLADTYLIEKKLGAGGMGTVFVAQNIRLGKRYALKVLNPEVAHSYPQAVERFKREAVTAGRLGHVGIVQVHDIAQTDDNILYMVMDLLDGEDLETRMAETGLLPWDAVYRIIYQTCDALATAHDVGIIHRDLKPANIFLSRRRGEGERAVLLDFGVAKVLDAQRALPDMESFDGARRGPTPTLTKPGTIVGTPNYMSPEQASGIAVDARADVYSMGAVLFHMATGIPPFNADSLLAVLTMIAIDPVPRIAAVNPRAVRPDGVDEVIARAMSKDPAARFQDVRALAAALPAPHGATISLAPAAPAGPTTLAGRPSDDEATPTSPGTPLPRSKDKVTETMHDGVAAKTRVEVDVTPTLPPAEPRRRSRAASLVVVGVLLVVGVVVGAVAALGPGRSGGSSSSTDRATKTAAGGEGAADAAPTEEALFSRGMAGLQREIEAESWNRAAGTVANLVEQFPDREPILRPMREQVEMELLGAAQHRQAAGQVTTDREEARRLCAQIQVRSVYRARPPCDELLRAPVATADAGAGGGPTQADAGAGTSKSLAKTSRPAGRTDRDIDKVYRRNRGAASRCFDRAFDGGFRPSGTITVSVRTTIDSAGQVSSASLLDPRYRSKASFKVCIENQVRGWQFPASSKSDTREFLFSYTAPELDLGE